MDGRVHERHLLLNQGVTYGSEYQYKDHPHHYLYRFGYMDMFVQL